MQAISALKRKGVASMFQFVPWHKLKHTGYALALQRQCDILRMLLIINRLCKPLVR